MIGAGSRVMARPSRTSQEPWRSAIESLTNVGGRAGLVSLTRQEGSSAFLDHDGAFRCGQASGPGTWKLKPALLETLTALDCHSSLVPSTTLTQCGLWISWGLTEHGSLSTASGDGERIDPPANP
ncbi:hypothetical protein ABH940_005803 [Streptacidiphilus sp. BW17]|jgi:hypothetical protein